MNIGLVWLGSVLFLLCLRHFFGAKGKRRESNYNATTTTRGTGRKMGCECDEFSGCSWENHRCFSIPFLLFPSLFFPDLNSNRRLLLPLPPPLPLLFSLFLSLSLSFLLLFIFYILWKQEYLVK